MCQHNSTRQDVSMLELQQFKFFKHLVKELPTEEACREYLENLVWKGEPVCPHCGVKSTQHYKLKHGEAFKGLYKCCDCRKRFTVTVGTMFEGSHLPLDSWFMTIYLFTTSKKGISSVFLHKLVGVTQKTAWFMLGRIRHSFKKDSIQFTNLVQVDETYVGGKARKRKKISHNQGRSTKTKTPVMGILSDDQVYAKVIPDASGKTLKPIINKLVTKGTTVVTDGWKGYSGLARNSYTHITVDHSGGIYVNAQGFHTNGIEGFWSQLKRGIIGVYHLVTPKHLDLYCDEFTYRYNTRKMNDGERFSHALLNANGRLKYKELTS